MPTPTPVPTATLAPTSTLTPRPTTSPLTTPIPKATPTPQPTLPSGDTGEWTYFCPECPSAYDNCAPFTSEGVNFISLYAYDSTNEWFHDEPNIRISCRRGSDLGFVFDGGGEWIGGVRETGLSIREAGQPADAGTWFWTEDNDLEYVGFDPRPSEEIMEILLEMEQHGQDVTLGVSGDYDTVVADFDVTGVATNLQRLPCRQG